MRCASALLARDRCDATNSPTRSGRPSQRCSRPRRRQDDHAESPARRSTASSGTSAPARPGATSRNATAPGGRSTTGSRGAATMGRSTGFSALPWRSVRARHRRGVRHRPRRRGRLRGGRCPRRCVRRGRGRRPRNGRARRAGRRDGHVRRRGRLGRRGVRRARPPDGRGLRRHATSAALQACRCAARTVAHCFCPHGRGARGTCPNRRHIRGCPYRWASAGRANDLPGRQASEVACRHTEGRPVI